MIKMQTIIKTTSRITNNTNYTLTYTVNPKYIKKIINATSYFNCKKEIIKRNYNQAIILTDPPLNNMELDYKAPISNNHKEISINVYNVPIDVLEQKTSIYEALAKGFLHSIKCKTIELVDLETRDTDVYPIDPYGVCEEEEFFSYE